MPSCSCIAHYGEVPCDLAPLISHTLSIGKTAWTFRADPESYKTCVVREGEPAFPKNLVDEVLETCQPHFGPGYWNRLVLSCVPAGEEILTHRDDFGETVRRASFHCHIPLITSPEAVLGFPEHGLEIHLEKGHLYSIDETEKHYVKNPSTIDRIHLLFAYFPHGGKK